LYHVTLNGRSFYIGHTWASLYVVEVTPVAGHRKLYHRSVKQKLDGINVCTNDIKYEYITDRQLIT